MLYTITILQTTALYAFPTITLPAKAVAAAEAKGFAADEYYCLQMLELAGIILVPGSGFGQEPGIIALIYTIIVHIYSIWSSMFIYLHSIHIQCQCREHPQLKHMMLNI
jgi:hypothetical protein